MKTLSIIILSLVSIFANAKQLTGKIINSATGQPLPFVNVLVISSNTGTVSDVNGNFTIILPSDRDTCTLLFSSTGFENFNLKLNNYTLNSLNGHHVNIPLDPKVHQFKGVVLYGQRPQISRVNTINK